MVNFLISNIWLILGTIFVLLTKTDYFRNKKFAYIACCVIAIVSSALSLFFSDGPWFEKVYAVLVIFVAIFRMIEVSEVKQSKEITITIDENTSFTVEKERLFKDALAGAEKGDPMSIYNLGCFYRAGMGTNINLNKSRDMFFRLTHCDDAFWQEEGKKELAIVEGMIKEKRREMVDAVKDIWG